MKNQPPIKFEKEKLYQWYIVEQRSFRWIMNEMNFNSARALTRALKEFNIPIRKGGEAVKTQWIDNEDRRKKTSERMKTNEEIIKIRKLPKSEEFKRKISEANKGQTNPFGEDNPSWLGGKKNWASGRRFSKSRRIKIIIDKGGKCQRCDEDKFENLTIHHIIPWRISKDHSLNNLEVLCKRCHFHQPHDIR